MGRQIPPDEVLAHPMRRAVLAHLIQAGGNSTSVVTSAQLGIHRQSLVKHAALLIRGGHLWVSLDGRGSRRTLTLHITRRGRNAIARAINPTPMMELSP
ncbi:DNA-binding MarR family transcriptional regulator [Bradyrhizobium sp. F1.4.3]|uniref:hypothetical protein n=1 Tax=Bradyrhizobium sp. F1.4.3 TaxID=3156356 RepID=UPI0033996364